MKTLLALLLAVSLTAQTPAPPPVDPPKPVTKVKKSGKKKWIILAAVAGGVIIGLVAANQRFGNEGRPIF